jgi:hypothetical protein
MTRDPLDLILGGTNPQSTAIDLTGNPVVQAAIEASYQQEAQIAAAKVVVAVVGRALQMIPVFGPAASYALTGQGDPQAIIAAMQQALAMTCGRGLLSLSAVDAQTLVDGWLRLTWPVDSRNTLGRRTFSLIFGLTSSWQRHWTARCTYRAAARW